MGLLINILEQGLIFSIMAIGVYITYRILDFPDLSVEGTFPLGAATAAVCLMNGINPFVACLLAFISGSIGGIITGLLHVKLKITNLLSGILVMIALYSINLRIMGKSNIPLFGKDTIFTAVSNPIIIIAIFALASKIILDLFLKTKLGFILKATGDNEQLVTSLGVNKNMIKIVGLMISNGLVALSGAIMAQYQGFADVGMGTGIVVMGLAAVIIGESILKKVDIVKGTTMAILGSVIYKAIIAIALELGFQPTDLKLVTVIIVIIALSLNNRNFSFKTRKKATTGGEVLVTDK
ncbi:branched-chain amino acid transport system / permease component family protein [Clostridium argentinense CDC 2741]|uniref:Branched-chain amino acid transport system / permease component family protein n=1 Tax=Clostridium argentinense CDC 2741 TaxID=1418104 RepID=A0A0C1QXL8_9CLOT|nr:ABC transporter [Clostridium argentinense]ARC83489.1 ABC transporter permease [Clostridium argentinense]KIE45747.1 branched-chain amino acid transport system / permease component family protein [Clostridium argentinense CDC 2741]NFF39063.1 ABC transporter permease [Clostridium argentinense]NFP49475.1 ABC transporter permease [Clostridium argentinense]NFP74163.1 ABC transporter permease [Clostridium argentinense]